MDGLKRLSLEERHRNFDINVMRKLRDQHDSIKENLVSKEARKAYEWRRQVLGCYQRIRAFSRLKISKHGILYTEIKAEHFVEDMVARWFKSRFPKCCVAIKSKRGLFYIDIDDELCVRDNIELDDFLAIIEKKRKADPIFAEIDDLDDELWDKYYKSQYIEERKNKRYFLNNIPKKYLKDMQLETREFCNTKKLDEFLK